MAMRVQSVIVPKTIAANRAQARAMVPDGFKRSDVDETGSSYRFRQDDPAHFDQSSFRTIPLGGRGVLAVIGRNPRKDQAMADHKSKAQEHVRAAVRALDEAATHLRKAGAAADRYVQQSGSGMAVRAQLQRAAMAAEAEATALHPLM